MITAHQVFCLSHCLETKKLAQPLGMYLLTMVGQHPIGYVIREEPTLVIDINIFAGLPGGLLVSVMPTAVGVWCASPRGATF